VITAVGSSPSTTDLVAQLAKRVDADNDGNISTTEFAQFLTDLLGAMSQGASAKTSSLASTSSATSIEDTPLPPCPGGWDAAKWTNPNHTTPKYVIGRILWRYPPTPESLAEALPAIQARYPGTTQVGQDKLQIPEWGLIDVGVDFGPGHGQSWAWQVVG
jgi:hypothetical protein